MQFTFQIYIKPNDRPSWGNRHIGLKTTSFTSLLCTRLWLDRKRLSAILSPRQFWIPSPPQRKRTTQRQVTRPALSNRTKPSTPSSLFHPVIIKLSAPASVNISVGAGRRHRSGHAAVNSLTTSIILHASAANFPGKFPVYSAWRPRINQSAKQLRNWRSGLAPSKPIRAFCHDTDLMLQELETPTRLFIGGQVNFSHVEDIIGIVSGSIGPDSIWAAH